MLAVGVGVLSGGIRAEGRQAGPGAVPCVPCQIFSAAPDEMAAVPATASGLTIAVRLPAGAPVPAAEMAALAARRARAALHLTGVPAAGDAIVRLPVDVVVIEPPGGDPDRLAFDLKRALAAFRGEQPRLTLLVAAPADLRRALEARGIAPYADGFVAASAPVVQPADLFAPVVPDTSVVRTLPAGTAAAAGVLETAAALAEWFPPGLVPVPERPLRCGDGRPIPAYLNPQTLDLVAASAACRAASAVTGDLGGVTAERRDVGPISAFRLRASGGDRFAERVSVGGARALTADEIVARHQAAASRQASEIRTDIAAGTLTLTFEAPTFVAPVTVTAATTIFRDAVRIDLRQADIRVNGVAFAPRDGVPRLPILEPERVAAAPLAITLTGVYRYALEGRELVDGRPCYVIGFTPRDMHASSFTGRAWIDQATFAMARVAAAQTGLKGPIVASEQTDTFAPDAAGRWLLARSDTRQTYEGAAIRTPIHRRLAIDRHEIDAPDFDARRAAAYASPDVILRDTPDGYRYLKRNAGSHEPNAGGGEPAAGRVLAAPVTRVRTLAVGVIVDPNISTPLPFAGVSYVDFDLFHTRTQFSGFFGGSYGQAAFSAPSLAGTRWQIAGRAFAIATAYNDRAFVGGTEIYARDIRQRPAHASIWALRPITPRASVRLEYDWDYNRFGRADVTDPAFVLPRNQNAHGLRAGLDAQYAGWQASIWASRTVRLGWRRWGIPGTVEDAPPRPSFELAGASLLRTTALSRRVTTRIELSATGGRRLDRFSRIAFGTFDNRLHGYPSALIRYDRGGVLRTAISWAAASAVRLDGFADTAAVHDPAFGRGLRRYTGVGAALEFPAPFGTLLAAEWGYGAQGIDTNGRTGTHVVRVTGYKVF